MSFERKVRLLGTIFLIFFVLVFVRLFYWQILLSGGLSSQADKQHFYSLEIPARRGEIKTKDGFVLAADKPAYLLYVNLQKFTGNATTSAEKLADIFAAEVPLVATDSAAISSDARENFFKNTKEKIQKELETKLNSKEAVWVNLEHFISPAVKDKITSLNIAGLDFADEETRDYPEASMAAHLLGFVGFDVAGSPKGYFGLEGFYDRELAGRPGELRIEKDAFGRPIAIGSESRQEKQDGRNLILTVNRGVQLLVEKNLEKGISDWKATGGTVIVMDPNNGAIIASASMPRYDPRNFSYYPSDLYKNPAIADLYEPGSIFKPLVMAAAMNAGKVAPATRCDKCDGPRQILNYYIHTFNDQYHPNLTMTEILINSDNTGMVFVGEKLGFKNLFAAVSGYGFGQKSGVDLQEEEEGNLHEMKDYYPIDQATMAFGQGINVNAMQMMRAWAVLANGGYLVTPHVVDQIETPSGLINLDWKRGRQLISEKTVKTLTEMLVRVCHESPEHFPLDRVPELAKFSIAAKSGTAQIALGGKYLEQGTIASLIGFFPADAPQFLVMVKLNEPEVRPWGSDTAGPVFFAILRDLVSYYGLAPKE